MIYPKGHPVHWKEGIKARAGSLHGTLTRDWGRHEQTNSYPWVLWSDATTEHQEYPECITPAQVGTSNAWDTYKPAKARAAR